MKAKAGATAMIRPCLAEGGDVLHFSGANANQNVHSAKCCRYLKTQLFQLRGLEPLPGLASKSHGYLTFHPAEQNRVASVILPYFYPE